MPNPAVISGSTELVASLAEVKRHARVIGNASDEVLTGYIKAATERIETVTARRFLFGSLRLTLDSFYDARYSRCGMIEPPVAPVRGVTTIEYIASGGSTYSTLSSTAYRVDTSREPARIKPVYGGSWPTTQPVDGAVRITFAAGFGSSTEAARNYVPYRARVAIGQLAAHWHENREAINVGNLVAKVPLAVDSLVESLKWERYVAPAGGDE